ncbi:hypothetical protein SAMN05421543_1213 [Alicyclobacillus macrosporangiidus]|uniref:HicA toxin of toxin-antitoxin n=1 Tax=Alicyclobacillus macrosporangiidus TaxID=392015 RepID=A0A1I7KYF0_9BACL|nr:hypothetical protein SAMN05421543_1213 [Alicyclobacillus macrosporangiidus]
MQPRKTREIEASLQRKGFRKSNRDHHYFVLYVDGKKTSVFTKTSHGMKEYDGLLLRNMARQLRLTIEQLYELIDCPLTLEDYIGILRDSGEI